MLNRVEEEPSSTSDIAKVGNIELQERGMKNLIAQLEGESSKDLPMCELLGPDKQLRSIQSSLKVEVVKRLNWKGRIEKEQCKLEQI